MMKSKKKNYFSYVVLAVVLIIPFFYSFFYLKAYWDPYGEGNIDNLPVAVVNLDKGDRGQVLVDTLKDTDKLKLDEVGESEATDGLYNKTYYAVITIPEDFTENMESAGSEVKKHPTITYSPNQKSNYLASQIVDKIILNVELTLDNEINSEIDGTLTDKLNEVPKSLETISDGLNTLESGTSKLKSGSSELNTGLKSLNDSYTTYSKGLTTVSKGSDTLLSSMEELNTGISTLKSSTSGLSSLESNISALTSGVSDLNTSEQNFNAGLSDYVDGVNSTVDFAKSAAPIVKAYLESTGNTNNDLYNGAVSIINGSTDTLTASGSTLKSSSSKIASGVSSLNSQVSSFSTSTTNLTKLNSAIDSISTGSNKIYAGMKTLNNGINDLSKANNEISKGITKLYDGSTTLNDGVITLNTSVDEAKNELDANIKDTKDELKKLDDLQAYSENPVEVDTKEVNKVSSYGTAFSPFFISIALWVGSLMLFVILYYDKENRFPKLSVDNPNHLKRSMYYHGLSTASAVMLGILLDLLLDFDVTNYFLYYISIILVANMFTAIMEFLIVNFKDVGKFFALILLVLQLAAAGGTFPIETVTKGFRFLNPILPMTYSINLLKEALVSIENSILIKNLVIVICIIVVFVTFNEIKNYLHDKKNHSI